MKLFIQLSKYLQNGEVKVGGKNIREICVGKLRQIIGVVSQEPVLFATTIGENIRWGKEDATQDEVIEAARQANALDFVSNLPEVDIKVIRKQFMFKNL